MKKETYIKMTEFWRNRKRLLSTLEFLYSFLPLLIFALYVTLLLYKFFVGINTDFLLSALVPLCTLTASVLLRKLINRERPYEKFSTPPAIEKDKKGKSLPSNHSASAFVIAMVAFNVNIYLWVFLMAVAVIIALTRFLSGVHFISDVLAGSFIGILAGLVFIFI